MTKQAELLAIAEKHKDHPAVSVLLTSIAEGRGIATTNMGLLSAIVTGREHAVSGQEGYYVPLDNSDMVVAAAKASAALTRIAGDFTNLACVLQSLGEPISY